MYSNNHNRILFKKLTRLFAFLFMFVCATISLHQQDRYLAELRTLAPSLVSTHIVSEVDSTPETYQRSSQHLTIAAERECPVCKFVADLTARVLSPQAPMRPVLVAYQTILWDHEKPFLPYRFCDRSSSRAPPLS